MEPERSEVNDEWEQQLEEDLAEDERRREPPPEEPAEPAAPPQPTMGRVVVMGSPYVSGHTVVLSGIPMGEPELYATMNRQTIDGKAAVAATFPRVPEGHYSVHQAANYTQIEVYAGEVTTVDWSSGGGLF